MKREKKIITGENEKKKSSTLTAKMVKNSRGGSAGTSRELNSSKKKKMSPAALKQGPSMRGRPPHVYHGFGTQRATNPRIPQAPNLPMAHIPRGSMNVTPSTGKLKSSPNARLPTTLPRIPPPAMNKSLLTRGNGLIQKQFTPWRGSPSSLVRTGRGRSPFVGGRGRGRPPPWVRPGRPPQFAGSGRHPPSLAGEASSTAASKITDSPNPASSSGLGTRGTSSCNTVDSSSRLQVEEIIDGEWSQMSSIRNIIDGEESTGTKLKEGTNGDTSYKGAMSHGQCVEKLPDMEFHNSCSGLSMLNSVGRSQSQPDSDHCPTTEGGVVRRKQHESIMSNVLGRAKEKQSRKAKVPSLNTTTEKKDLKLNGSGNDVSPIGKQLKSVPNSASGADGATMGRSSQFSMDTMDAFNFSNFSLGDNSHLSPGRCSTRATSAIPTSTGYSQAFLNAPSTTGEFNMNSLMGPDFCAISALNQLSNSSVPFHNDATTGDEEGEEKKKSPDEKSGKTEKVGKAPKPPPKTSFYERVMANKAISKK